MKKAILLHKMARVPFDLLIAVHGKKIYFLRHGKKTTSILRMFRVKASLEVAKVSF